MIGYGLALVGLRRLLRRRTCAPELRATLDSAIASLWIGYGVLAATGPALADAFDRWELAVTLAPLPIALALLFAAGQLVLGSSSRSRPRSAAVPWLAFATAASVSSEVAVLAGRAGFRPGPPIGVIGGLASLAAVTRVRARARAGGHCPLDVAGGPLASDAEPMSVGRSAYLAGLTLALVGVVWVEPRPPAHLLVMVLAITGTTTGALFALSRQRERLLANERQLGASLAALGAARTPVAILSEAASAITTVVGSKRSMGLCFVRRHHPGWVTVPEGQSLDCQPDTLTMLEDAVAEGHLGQCRLRPPNGSTTIALAIPVASAVHTDDVLAIDAFLVDAALIDAHLVDAVLIETRSAVTSVDLGQIEQVMAAVGAALEAHRLREKNAAEATKAALRPELRYRALIGSSRDVFVALAQDLTINYISPNVEQLLGLVPADLTGTNLSAVLAFDSVAVLEDFLANRKQAMQRETLELELRTESRRTRLVEATLSDDRNGPDDAYVMTLSDITERRQLEASLRKQALYDPLTGVANRSTLHFELQQRLQRLTASEHLGLIHLDLDDFRAVNESIGYERGDELLVQVATRLRSNLRASDVLARIGGNEFAIIVSDSSPHAIVEFAHRVVALFNQPFDVADRQQRLAVSVGLDATGDRQAVARDLLDQAALALGAAKGNPQDPVRAYEPRMRVTAVERFELGTDLVGAIGRHELRVVYQPIVELAELKIHGVEALLRWIHPLRGPVSPAVFIPLAEKSGLVTELGRWVMAQACGQLRYWHRHVSQAATMGVSVNVSARQLEVAGEAELLGQIMIDSGVEPRHVTIELTESTFLDDPELIRTQLQTFCDLGMRIAVDDFGTGAAGLSHLRDVPFNSIKIDKSYVDALDGSEEAKLLVQGVIDLAHTLGAETVAEGVEEAAELELLRAMGCDLVQGFYLGRPMDPAQLETWLTTNRVAQV